MSFESDDYCDDKLLEHVTQLTEAADRDANYAIASIVQTCDFCPSQWEGRLRDGRPFYIRYRHGQLRVSIAKSGSSIDDAVMGQTVVSELSGHFLDGAIDIEDVLPKMMTALRDLETG